MSSSSLREFIVSATGRAWAFEPNEATDEDSRQMSPAAAGSAVVPDPASSETQETQTVESSTPMPGVAEFQEIHGPQEGVLFLATAQAPVASIPANISYRRQPQPANLAGEPLSVQAETIPAHSELTHLEDNPEFRVRVPVLGRPATHPWNVARLVPRAEPSSQRNVYVPPFRRGRQTAEETPTPLAGYLPASRWPVEPLPGPRRPAPAAIAPPPGSIADAEARGMILFGLEEICPCNLDGHPCMLPLRCRYRKNIICTTHDCQCGKLHIPATCDSLRVVGRQCEFGGAGTCWFGHDGMSQDGRMETVRWDKAREHPAHHRGD